MIQFPSHHLALAIVAGVAVAFSPLIAADFTTNPVGFNKVVCLGGADTVVSVPFVRQPSLEVKVQAATSPAQNRVQLTIAGNTNWTGDQYADTHYVRFISGARAGQWYDVVNNSSDTLMLDTAGDDLLTNVAANDQLLLAPHWTLDSLFPPDDQGNGPGAVIHRSQTHNEVDRRSEVELPNLAEGSNLSAGPIYYLTANGWHLEATGTPLAGETIIPPSSSFIIRHRPGYAATTFSPAGSVLMGPEVVTLATSASGLQDNEVAITRPVPVALDQSGLESAFVESLGHRSFQIRDRLLVFDGAVFQGKVNSEEYYRLGGNWYQNVGLGTTNPISNSTAIFKPGQGVVVRKFPSTGASFVWTNQPSY